MVRICVIDHQPIFVSGLTHFFEKEGWSIVQTIITSDRNRNISSITDVDLVLCSMKSAITSPKIFEEIKYSPGIVVFWNDLYKMSGEFDLVFKCFGEIINKSVDPDDLISCLQDILNDYDNKLIRKNVVPIMSKTIFEKIRNYS